jgi:hypothetical protein
MQSLVLQDGGPLYKREPGAHVQRKAGKIGVGTRHREVIEIFARRPANVPAAAMIKVTHTLGGRPRGFGDRSAIQRAFLVPCHTHERDLYRLRSVPSFSCRGRLALSPLNCILHCSVAKAADFTDSG